MRIAVDAMGGDRAPDEMVKGCVEALNAFKDHDIEIILVGQQQVIDNLLQDYDYDKSRLHIEDALEVISNDEKPVNAIKKKRNSSMMVGLQLLKEKKTEAFISAGNTGALMAGALLKVGRIEGIDRPALAPIIPTVKGASLLVDAGANIGCKAEHLMQFAVMGSVYMEKVLNIPSPRVGLVNVGEEETKGNDIIQEAYTLIKATHLNFIGNIEARDIPAGKADVIVCDGFVGNVILKLLEGIASSLFEILKQDILKSWRAKLGALLLMPTLKGLMKEWDYAEYGGALLLGIDGLIIKAHGSSDASAIKNAIKQAEIFVSKDVLSQIRNEIVMVEDKSNEQ